MDEKMEISKMAGPKPEITFKFITNHNIPKNIPNPGVVVYEKLPKRPKSMKNDKSYDPWIHGIRKSVDMPAVIPTEKNYFLFYNKGKTAKLSEAITVTSVNMQNSGIYINYYDWVYIVFITKQLNIQNIFHTMVKMVIIMKDINLAKARYNSLKLANVRNDNKIFMVKLNWGYKNIIKLNSKVLITSVEIENNSGFDKV